LDKKESIRYLGDQQPCIGENITLVCITDYHISVHKVILVLYCIMLTDSSTKPISTGRNIIDPVLID